MRLIPTALVLFTLTGLPAAAACLDQGLSCTMPRGKLMEVCAGTEMFTYSYGTSDITEIELEMRYADADVTPWNGMGFEIWSSARFTKGDYSYEVWTSAPRTPGGITSAGVTVSRKGTEIAALRCIEGSVEGSAEFFTEALWARGG